MQALNDLFILAQIRAIALAALVGRGQNRN